MRNANKDAIVVWLVILVGLVIMWAVGFSAYQLAPTALIAFAAAGIGYHDFEVTGNGETLMAIVILSGVAQFLASAVIAKLITGALIPAAYSPGYHLLAMAVGGIGANIGFRLRERAMAQASGEF